MTRKFLQLPVLINVIKVFKNFQEESLVMQTEVENLKKEIKTPYATSVSRIFTCTELDKLVSECHHRILAVT